MSDELFQNILQHLEQRSASSPDDDPTGRQEKVESTTKLSSVNIKELYYDFYQMHRAPTGRRPDSIEVAKDQEYFKNKLMHASIIDSETFKVTSVPPVSENADAWSVSQAAIEKIKEEKLKPLRDQLEAINGSDDSAYAKATSLYLQARNIQTMVTGISISIDREFFQHVPEELMTAFQSLKNEVRDLMQAAREKRDQFVQDVFPIESLRFILDVSPEEFFDATSRFFALFSDYVTTQLPDHPNQRGLVTAMMSSALKRLWAEATNVDQKYKVIWLSLPYKLDQWDTHKLLSKLNDNYTGDGIANVAFADQLLELGEVYPHAMAEMSERLKDNVTNEVWGLSDEQRSLGIYFIREIEAIYESRKGIAELRQAIKGESALLTPERAMEEVSALYRAMEAGDIKRVIEVVERLEDKKIDCYHVIPPSAHIENIVADGFLVSKWSEEEYGDRFFGGGIYFWAGQQEFWLKGGSEAFHVVLPLKDIFVTRNKYNNPLTGPHSTKSRARYTDPYPHPQKKYNLMAMLPMNALIMKETAPSEHFPLNNEGYSSENLVDINAFEYIEANIIWRCDKHYGHYDADYTISAEKETLIKEALGDKVRIDRNVRGVGFIAGEYDRLVVPRSISILRATTVAYALRIVEVAYDDKVLDLEANEAEIQADIERSHIEYKESLPEQNQEITEWMNSLKGSDVLTDKDRLITEVYFYQLNEDFRLRRLHSLNEGVDEEDSPITDLFEEIKNLHQILEGDMPSLDRIRQFTPRKEWFVRDSTIHGTPHIMRVLVLAEILGRLAKKNTPAGKHFDLEALEVAVMLHDVRRFSDSGSDIKHGERAAAFLDTLPGYEGVNTDLAKRIMHFHSLDDYDGMTPEELVMKDADAWDRYRFTRGPDMRFFRTPFSMDVMHSAFHLARLSSRFLSLGYSREEAVLKAATALKLVTEPEDTNQKPQHTEIDVDALLSFQGDMQSAIGSGPGKPAGISNEQSQMPLTIDELLALEPSGERRPGGHTRLPPELVQEVTSTLLQADEVLALGETSTSLLQEEFRTWDDSKKREMASTIDNSSIILELAQDRSPIIRSFVCLNPHAPGGILRQLARHNSFFAKLVAANPSAPPDLLTELADHPEEEVRKTVATNPSIPTAVKIRLETF